jgi:glycosyltransferase involved in cell wall biosynthesis
MAASSYPSRTPDLPDVCVVTHPLAAAGENATRSLLDILAAITGVALVTADLPADSAIRDRHELVEITSEGAGDSVLVAAARFLLNQLRMCLVLARRDEDVVLFYGATSYLLPILFARAIGRTVLIEPRGDVPLTLRIQWEQELPSPIARILAALVRALERAGFAAANGVVTYTPEMSRQLDLDPDSPRVYPWGARYVQTDRFDVRTPFAERERRVGFLGRLDEEKNVRELAAVAKRLPEGVTFTFIGDGDLREWLEAELADEIASGSVEMRGWVDHDDVPAELNRLRLVVLPSEPTEGLPTSILEALACGTPVYATPVSGVPDVVRDGETGFLMDETDPDAILRDLRSILDREDLAEVSRNGRELIEAEYSFAAAKRRYRDILLAAG